MSVTVVVADDHQIIRQGLRLLFGSQADMELVGEAENGQQAVDLVAQLHPLVAVMDVSMPVLDGFEATRQVRSRFPEVKVIALSMHNDPIFVEGMKSAGANGYVLKDAAFEQLAEAIRSVLAGGEYFPS